MNLESQNIRVIASEQSWIESEAIRQLKRTAALPGVKLAVGFPDLHPGKGHPVGAAIVANGHLYPFLIGNDIGCGMTFCQTDLSRRKLKLDRWSDRVEGLETPWEGDVTEWLNDSKLPSTRHDSALGTIGGGNHFAELQQVHKVVDEAVFKSLHLNKDQLFLLVHSGSRGLGEEILRNHVAKFKADGVSSISDEATHYLGQHDEAVIWAGLNRRLIAHRFLRQLGGDFDVVWDGCHNRIERYDGPEGVVWVHRKGAAPSDRGAVVIPGSRGTLSYLVQPMGDGREHAWSLAHGTGRKWTRNETYSRMRDRFKADQLTHTELGGRVICENRELLFEEAPTAYKKIEQVIGDLEQAGLVRVVATLQPLLTYKTRNQKHR